MSPIFVDAAPSLLSRLQTRLPSSPASPDKVSIMCLTLHDGGCSRSPLSRRRSSTCNQFLLVEIPSDIDDDGDREELLAMYESMEGVARRMSLPPGEHDSRGNSVNGGCRRHLLMRRLARNICPYFGVLRVRVGTETASSRPQRSVKILDAPRSPTCPGEGEKENTRLFLALGDPREGMRSPCTLTIKIEAAGDAAPAPPLQVLAGALASAASRKKCGKKVRNSSAFCRHGAMSRQSFLK